MDQSLLRAFGRCRTEAETDEARVAALVAEVLDPDLDAATIERDLQVLGAACPAGLMPWHYLAERGFDGNRDDYGSLDNSNLARVLECRRGIPITLGVVLIQVARVSGHQAVGINFPGHFIVEVDDVLVDPFVLAPLNRREFLERLPASTRQASERVLFTPASPVAVGLRMLNNVKLAFSREAAWHKTLDAIDAQLELAPQQPALHLERGDVWLRLGLVAPARESFERAVEAVADVASQEADQVRRAARARLHDLPPGDDVEH